MAPSTRFVQAVWMVPGPELVPSFPLILYLRPDRPALPESLVDDAVGIASSAFQQLGTIRTNADQEGMAELTLRESLHLFLK